MKFLFLFLWQPNWPKRDPTTMSYISWDDAKLAPKPKPSDCLSCSSHKYFNLPKSMQRSNKLPYPIPSPSPSHCPSSSSKWTTFLASLGRVCHGKRRGGKLGLGPHWSVTKLVVTQFGDANCTSHAIWVFRCAIDSERYLANGQPQPGLPVPRLITLSAHKSLVEKEMKKKKKYNNTAVENYIYY